MKEFIRTSEWKNFVVKRITQLRTATPKPISSRKLSQELNKCESYINKIETGQTLPSLEKLFEICEYFDITPAEFFSDNTNPYEKSEMEELYSAMDSDSRTLLTLLAKKLAGNNKKK